MTGAASFNESVEKMTEQQRKLLFVGCFVALIATAFGFIVRVLLADQWALDLSLTETEKGEILGAGLWPFSISIILFSLVIDRIGYGTAMVFAFVGHVVSAILTFTAHSYGQLYAATVIVALANGAVEAVINPVVATLFSREKTKWLNILHAGWPGGLVLGGLLTIALGEALGWRQKMLLLLIPTLIYGILLFRRTFPVQERVAAGVSYRDMLREFGFVAAFIASALVFGELTRVLGPKLLLPAESGPWIAFGLAALTTLAFGVYTGFALGNPVFLVLVLIMIPLAITELGTDSWITSLMTPEMEKVGLAAGWVLVYTSLIMAILRFCAGPIVHRLSPLGLLATSATIAMIGLVSLSKAAGIGILLAATLYGMGKTFFWPTMLGVVSEQAPRGGALTLNAIAGVGMLGVGIVGNMFIGYIQDTTISRQLREQQPAIYQRVRVEKVSILGRYEAVDPAREKELAPQEREAVTAIANQAKKEALATMAIFPGIMLLGYLGLIVYFRSRGGYKAEVLTGHRAEDEEFTGGVEGPVEA